MFDSRVLRKKYELTRDEAAPQTAKLYDLYSSPDAIRVISSRRMRWAGRVARMGEKGGA